MNLEDDPLYEEFLVKANVRPICKELVPRTKDDYYAFANCCGIRGLGPGFPKYPSWDREPNEAFGLLAQWDRPGEPMEHPPAREMFRLANDNGEDLLLYWNPDDL